MRFGPLGLAVAVVLVFASETLVSAQPAGSGLVIGEVAVCNNSNEIPAPNVNVGIDGGRLDLARTDAKGAFTLTLPAGDQYTIVATAADGSRASIPYVPVLAGQTLDIGILDLNAGLTGCGFDADLPPNALATATPLPTVALPEPIFTPTPLPTLELPAPAVAPDTSAPSDSTAPPDDSDGTGD
jgi:hypothetical protein